MAALIAFAFLFSTGCLSLVIPPHSSSEDAELVAQLSAGDYRGSGFVEVDKAAYVSGLHASDWVRVFVSVDAADAYRAVDPDSMNHGAPFPVGGAIVREVLDGSMKVQKLTVMQKRAPGYYPDSGDFLFGVTDVNGNPLIDDHGQTQWGALTACGPCHQTRAAAGYLFGVKLGAR
jgi:hypothetical protein